MSSSYWKFRPADKPLTAGEMRQMLREEAGHILRVATRAKTGLARKDAARAYRPGQPKTKVRPAIRAMTNATMLVYVVGSYKGPVKIGIAHDVEKRLSALQTGHPHELRIYGTVEVPADIAREVEMACHGELASRRLRGEWFKASPNLALTTVEMMAARLASA